MTEVLEPVAAFLIGDMDHNENTCSFCRAVAKQTGTNKTVAHIDTDIKGYEGPLDNDAGELGKNLGGKPDRQDLTFEGKIGSLPSAVAAHHLIPGNDSLASSQLILGPIKYLHVNGSAAGNIGYDINNAENGVWTPGPYAMYTPPKVKGGKGIKGWKDSMQLRQTGGQVDVFVSKQEYAKACIEQWRCQFHDSHGRYSKKVRGALDMIYTKMEVLKSSVCPNAQEKKPPEYTFYSLLAHLAFISGQAKKYVEYQHIEKYWTEEMALSGLSEKYIEDYKKAKSKGMSGDVL